MKIGITGAEGLLGFHLRAYLHALGRHEVRLASRQTFSQAGALEEFVRNLDGIVHLAGMNRGADADVEATNIALAEALVAAMERVGNCPALVYSNSTHIDRDTAYGRGKRAAAGLLGAWADRNGASFTDLVLPHVFGEGGKPFYNSVVSTFCYQLARGDAPEIHFDGQLELVHAQTVAKHCIKAIEAGYAGIGRLAGAPMKVSELLGRLRLLLDTYRKGVVPDLGNELDLQLFNTLRSYLYPSAYPIRPELREDARGSLFEAVKALQGGQTFFSTTHPRITRGNHYHLRKMERFLVVSGRAEIRLRRLFSDVIETFEVDGSRPCYVDMPTLHTHSITNIGAGELMTLFWTNEIFDPADPDTYEEAVCP